MKTPKEGPAFSFRPKTSVKQEDFVPGPGKYDPRNGFVQEKSPAWVVGRSQRDGIAGKNGNVPGPGTYTHGNTLGGPKWGFGSGKREKKFDTFVPGAYEIKSTVGAAPTYAQVPK